MTSDLKQPLETKAGPIPNLNVLANEWCALEPQSVNHLFFLSWHWIGTRLKTLPEGIRRRLLRIHSRDRTLGLGVIIQGRTPVLKLFRLPQTALNATGDTGLDNIAIEYNGFLTAGGFEEEVIRSALDWFLSVGPSNQSVLLPGIDPILCKATLTTARGG